MAELPIVAIVGRPNVGKSTLFNRLVGKRRAIVHDQPGVTRDRIVERARLGPRHAAELIDTGGLVPGDDPLGLSHQVRLAIGESDAVLLLVDGAAGPTGADEILVDELRRAGKPWLLVVTKGDRADARAGFDEFFRLGAGEPVLVSAEHGFGLPDLIDRLVALLPAVEWQPDPELPALAIVGRPNVGKSSLLNRLVGEERALVAPTAGTTRDPVDSVVARGEQRYRLVDTAGIRRRAQVSGAPEDLAVLLARRQLERAEVAILVIDGSAGVTSGDLAIAGAIWEAGRASVAAINKWDLVVDERRERLEASWPRLAEVLAEPPRVNVSALSGRGVEKLFPAAEAQLARARRTVSTGELNRLLERLLAERQPPGERGRPWRFFYATQVGGTPPTFMLFANRSLPIQHPYRRFLVNRLRDELDSAGIPLRLVVRRRGAAAAR